MREKPEERQRVIVQLGPGEREGAVAAISAAGLELEPSLTSSHLVASGSAAQVAAAAGSRSVLRLSTDAPVASPQVPTFTNGTVLRDTMGFLKGGGIISGGNSFAGDKVGVAIIDSGIQIQKDIEAGRIRAFFDFTRGGPAASPYDDYGHGTHVAGLVGGSGDLSSDKFEGPASKAYFIGYKVLDREGAGYTTM